MDDLIRKITRNLGVSREQARGGVVALLRAGQQNLSPADFKAFVADVPGADKLLKNAPPPSALSSLAGGIGSLFGGRKSATGRWAGLAASFAELGASSRRGIPSLDSSTFASTAAKTWSTRSASPSTSDGPTAEPAA